MLRSKKKNINKKLRRVSFKKFFNSLLIKWKKKRFKNSLLFTQLIFDHFLQKKQWLIAKTKKKRFLIIKKMKLKRFIANGKFLTLYLDAVKLFNFIFFKTKYQKKNSF